MNSIVIFPGHRGAHVLLSVKAPGPYQHHYLLELHHPPTHAMPYLLCFTCYASHAMLHMLCFTSYASHAATSVLITTPLPLFSLTPSHLQIAPNPVHTHPHPQTSLLGYSTLVVGPNSSFMLLMLTNRPMMAALPALSLVPDALAPPNGCWPTTAPVLLQLM